MSEMVAARWACAIEGKPPLMLKVALKSLLRQGIVPLPLPERHGESCVWIQEVARCFVESDCLLALLFVGDPAMACCVANKVSGVRAAVAFGLVQANQAMRNAGANFLIASMDGHTYYEYRELLRLCGHAPVCPPGLARLLGELDGHAHR